MEIAYIASHEALKSDFIEKRMPSIMLSQTVVFFVGLFFCLWAYLFESDTSILYFFLMTVGGATALIALCRLAFGCRGVIYKYSGSPVKHLAYYYEVEDFGSLLNIIESEKWDTLCSLKKKDGMPVCLNVWYTKDKKFAAVQLFKYVPYSYEPASELHSYSAGDAEQLIKIARGL